MRGETQSWSSLRAEQRRPHAPGPRALRHRLATAQARAPGPRVRESKGAGQGMGSGASQQEQLLLAGAAPSSQAGTWPSGAAGGRAEPAGEYALSGSGHGAEALSVAGLRALVVRRGCSLEWSVELRKRPNSVAGWVVECKAQDVLRPELCAQRWRCDVLRVTGGGSSAIVATHTPPHACISAFRLTFIVTFGTGVTLGAGTVVVESAHVVAVLFNANAASDRDVYAAAEITSTLGAEEGGAAVGNAARPVRRMWRFCSGSQCVLEATLLLTKRAPPLARDSAKPLAQHIARELSHLFTSFRRRLRLLQSRHERDTGADGCEPCLLPWWPERGDPAVLASAQSAQTLLEDAGFLVYMRGELEGDAHDVCSPLACKAPEQGLGQVCDAVSDSWLLSGLLASVLRLLGVPCRLMTLFNAGHQQDASPNASPSQTASSRSKFASAAKARLLESASSTTSGTGGGDCDDGNNDKKLAGHFNVFASLGAGPRPWDVCVEAWMQSEWHVLRFEFDSGGRASAVMSAAREARATTAGWINPVSTLTCNGEQVQTPRPSSILACELRGGQLVLEDRSRVYLGCEQAAKRESEWLELPISSAKARLTVAGSRLVGSSSHVSLEVRGTSLSAALWLQVSAVSACGRRRRPVWTLAGTRPRAPPFVVRRTIEFADIAEELDRISPVLEVVCVLQVAPLTSEADDPRSDDEELEGRGSVAGEAAADESGHGAAKVVLFATSALLPTTMAIEMAPEPACETRFRPTVHVSNPLGQPGPALMGDAVQRDRSACRLDEWGFAVPSSDRERFSRSLGCLERCVYQANVQAGACAFPWTITWHDPLLPCHAGLSDR